MYLCGTKVVRAQLSRRGGADLPCTPVTLVKWDITISLRLRPGLQRGAEQKAAMGNGRDRRRWVRHRFYAPVRISFEDRNQSSIIEGRCLKLSEGGMSLFAAANVAVGTRVKVDFLTSASEQHISVMGTIRNRMVYLYGVEY